MDGTVQPFNLAVAVGGIRLGTHVFNPSGFAEGIKSTLKFGTIVGTHTQWGPKNLKDLLVYSSSDSRTGFVRYGSDDYEFTKAAYSN